MYRIEVALNVEPKSRVVRELVEIRVFDETEQIDTIKQDKFFDFSWLAGRRYSFVGRQSSLIVFGESISYVAFFADS